jgi:phosphoglycolate phosphatase-like HAD superfamily hydrolase
MDHQAYLKKLEKEHDFFIGIDSDGCVFDTMEVKQKEFFIPAAMRIFELFPVSKTVRETWEFVNLYSVHRGVNRFPALVKVFDMLAKREEIVRSGFVLPDLTALKDWIKNETRLSNTTLRKHYESTGDIRLEKVVRWSEQVNSEISRWLRDIRPFPHAVKALERISQNADAIVISQTPLEALEREWEEHDLRKFVDFVAAQEHGTKSEHISLAAKRRYPDERILLIGDAFGDLDAAKANNVLFFPIVPGKEDYSWERFLNEGLERFLNLDFEGEYQESLLEEFMKSLPDTPPWETKPSL